MTRGRAVVARLGMAWLVCWALGAWGQALQPVPALTGRVVDTVGWLAPEARSGLEARLGAIETRGGSQVAILLVATTRPEPVEAYSIRVVDAWKLGRQGIDDGVLILVARDDRTLRIEVGRGLEGAIPDALAKGIIEDRMVPRLKQGDLPGALDAALDAVEARLAGEALPEPERARVGPESNQDWIGIVLMAAILGGQVLRLLLGPVLGPAVAAALVGAGVWWISGLILLGVGAGIVAFILLIGGGRGGSGPWISGGGGGFGSGGGRSGGWSGGGGGFSGGGASGRW